MATTKAARRGMGKGREAASIEDFQ